MTAASFRGSRGATLIELMISSSLGLIVIAAVGTLFMASSRSMKQDERMSMMNQELAYAIAQLVQDIEMAGHWARLHDPARVELHGNLSVAQDCGAGTSAWVYADRTAISVVDNATGADTNDRHQCIPATGILPGSDVIAIKRVMGSPAGTDTNMAAQLPGAVYLRSGNLAGRMYLNDGAAFGNVPPPFENWEYRPVIYYIRSSFEDPGEPALCRHRLQATGSATPPAFVGECLAQGVESMHVELGVDTDGDGAANYFWPPPPPAVPVALSALEQTQVVRVRLFLLARSIRPDTNHTEADGKSYMFSNMQDPHVPADDSIDRHYYHRTLSTEMVVRNPRTLQGVAIQ